MRTLGIGSVMFDIPAWFEAHDDGDGTLVAYPPNSNYANIRVSVSTIATEDGKPSLDVGERIVRSRASKENRELHQDSGKVWYSWSQIASEGSAGSIITFWQVGVGAHMPLVSCFIDSEEGDASTKERIRQAVIPIIRSFRVDYAPNQALEPTASRSDV
jgi:hypothetical protein